MSEHTSEEDLIKQGWRRCAEGQRATQYCAEAERHRQQSDAIFSVGARLALELECLLLETRDTAAVSKWWDSAHEALQQGRDVIGGLEESLKPLDAPFAPDWANYRQGRKDGYAEAIEEAAARLESVGCGHCAENVKGLLQERKLLAETANDLTRCPRCGGPADNGHDREVPPNPYWCSKCTEQPAKCME